MQWPSPLLTPLLSPPLPREECLSHPRGFPRLDFDCAPTTARRWCTCSCIYWILSCIQTVITRRSLFLKNAIKFQWKLKANFKDLSYPTKFTNLTPFLSSFCLVVFVTTLYQHCSHQKYKRLHWLCYQMPWIAYWLDNKLYLTEIVWMRAYLL